MDNIKMYTIKIYPIKIDNIKCWWSKWITSKCIQSKCIPSKWMTSKWIKFSRCNVPGHFHNQTCLLLHSSYSSSGHSWKYRKNQPKLKKQFLNSLSDLYRSDLENSSIFIASLLFLLFSCVQVRILPNCLLPTLHRPI